ncbi:MAG: CPXCG motif-containing cysteine-rich protein [Anaerolineales bacterium]
MLETIEISCPHCGELNDLELDRSGGDRQEFIEDCWVCCRPIQYSVTFATGEGPRVNAAKAY